MARAALPSPLLALAMSLAHERRPQDAASATVEEHWETLGLDLRRTYAELAHRVSARLLELRCEVAGVKSVRVKRAKAKRRKA